MMAKNRKTLMAILMAVLMVFLMMPMMAENAYADTDNINLKLSLYDGSGWIDADNNTYITSALINGVDTRSVFSNVGDTATISVIPADGYMVTSMIVKENETTNYSMLTSQPEEYRYGTNQETGEYTLTFIPQSGVLYSFSAALHEAVRVTFDLNGGTAGDNWLGDTRLESKGAVLSTMSELFEDITPPEGKVLDAIEMKIGSATYMITASDLNSTAHSFDSDVTFKCIWKTKGQTNPQNGPAKVAVPTPKTGLVYNGKKQTGVDAGADYKVSGNTAKNAGSYKATLSLKDKKNYTWADGTTANKTVKWTIVKAANTLSAKGKTKAVIVKSSTLNRRAKTLKASEVIKFTDTGKGNKNYKLVSVKKENKSYKKYFAVNKKNGKLTVKKGLKKGTYIVKVKIRAAGNANYKASENKTVKFKIKIK